MSKEKKKLAEKLSGTVAEVNEKGEADFEKLAGELQHDLQQLSVDFNEKLQELDVIEAEKKNKKVGYERCLDAGDQTGMSVCLSEIRGRNVRAEELRSELEKFSGRVKELFARKTKIFAIARDGQQKAEADLRAAEKALKLTGGRVKRCYALSGLIGDVNKDVEDLIRVHKKEKEVFEDEVRAPRSSQEGFWLEPDDPFSAASLRLYQSLKGVDDVSLPLLLKFKDREANPRDIDEARLRAKFEKDEALQAEFGGVEKFLEFKRLIIVQVLEAYVLRSAGGGERRRAMAARVGLRRCL